MHLACFPPFLFLSIDKKNYFEMMYFPRLKIIVSVGLAV